MMLMMMMLIDDNNTKQFIVPMNFLSSLMFSTEKGYPLKIEATKIEIEESPCDAEFIEKMLMKIDYKTLLFAKNEIIDRCSAELGSDFVFPELPESIVNSNHNNGVGDDNDSVTTNNISLDEELIKKLHLVLLDIHIVEGHLICPDTGRRFKVSNGIPNMILHEDEI